MVSVVAAVQSDWRMLSLRVPLIPVHVSSSGTPADFMPNPAITLSVIVKNSMGLSHMSIVHDSPTPGTGVGHVRLLFITPSAAT